LEFIILVRTPFSEAIYASTVQSRLDHYLLVEDFTFRRYETSTGTKRAEGVGVIKCTTPNGQTKVKALLDRIGLSQHIAKTA
jgi:hypothetical protein